jgi:serine/threonine-protein kinase
MEPTTRTPAGDQYSLGCVLYFALTGRVPFPEGSAVEKMMAHQTKEPVAITELAPDVPAGLETVVKRLMAKTPEGRFNGCDELVEALEPFLGDMNTGNGSSNRSGARPGLGNRSSTTMPGLPPRPAAGAKVTLPTKSAPAAPAERPRANPSPNVAPAPGTRTPQPNRGPSGIPSRASFQLPAVDEAETGATSKAPTPVESPRTALPKLPTRGATSGKAAPAAPARGAQAALAPSPSLDLEPVEDAQPTSWSDDAAPERKGGAGVGPVALVLIAVVLMAAVYFGATMLMK